MLETRYRVEWWDAHKGQTDDFHALRTRVAAKFTYKSLFSLFAEFQDSRIYDLSANTSGAGALYRRFSKGGDSDHTNGQALRQAWLELRPIEGLSIRAGRTDIKLGTQAMYAEPNWKYLKINRASQRLVGTVGWTHGERSNDGGSLAYDTEGYHLYFFGAQPTTGVFDISGGYKRQPDIAYGGASLTAKRGTWLRDTELRGFFLGYSDNRPVEDGGKPRGRSRSTHWASRPSGSTPAGPATSTSSPGLRDRRGTTTAATIGRARASWSWAISSRRSWPSPGSGPASTSLPAETQRAITTPSSTCSPPITSTTASRISSPSRISSTCSAS